MRKCASVLVLAASLLLCGSDWSPTYEEALLFSTEPSKMAGAYAELLASGFDANQHDADGLTLLFTAAKKDRMDIAAWLLEHGADVNARDRWKNTVLHYIGQPMEMPLADGAAWARLLVKHGIDVNAQNVAGWTALAGAAEMDGQLDFITYLVSVGADVNLGDNEGIAPLSHASQHGRTKNAALLKSKGARPYSYQFPVDNAAPACAAVLSGDPARIARVPEADLRAMVGRTSLGVPATPLHLAAEQAPLKLVAALCARKLDWNVGDRYGRSPLSLAVLGGRADVVTLLLDNGADPFFAGTESSTPLSFACATQPAIARMMMARGALPRDEKALCAAVASGDLDLVKAIVEAGTMSPRALPLAARHGTLPMTEYLAEVFPGPDRAQALSDARAMRSELNRYHVGSPLRTPDPGAVIAAAGKHGDFPHVVESWSPWTKTPPPMSLARYPVGIHVPRGYDGKTPWGLFISMTNAASSSRYPRAFAPTLEKHRIIWAGFDPYLRLFTISPDANTDFCLAILWDMLGSYSIDPSRIYIGGFSLGGQMTEDVLRIHPWPFSGAMFINIGLWGGLARGFNGGAGMRPQVPWTLENLRLVFVEGDYDYNRTGVYEDYTDLLHAGARSISYIQEPMSPHRLINAESFEKAISFLDRESGSER